MVKSLVVGWDGATWSRLQSMIADGAVPNIEALTVSGTEGTIRSTDPPMTPLAWTTAATGVNPGKHGVYDFLEQNNETYAITPTDFGKMDRPTLWDLFDSNDIDVGFLNYPVAYPPPSIDGCFVSGFPHSLDDNIAHPESLAEYLESIEYQVQPERSPKESPSAYLQEVKDLASTRTDVALYLLEEHGFEAFCVVFMGIDWIQHYLWDVTVDGEDAVEEIYRHMDTQLGRLLDAVDEEWNTILLSDHGFRKIDSEIHLNSLLEEWGYLERKGDENGVSASVKQTLLAHLWKVGRRLPDRVKQFGKQNLDSLTDSMTAAAGAGQFVDREIDWAQTKAFSYGAMGRVFVHDEQRYQEGTVSSAEQETVQAELIEKLELLSHPESGEPIVDAARTATEVYEGPKTHSAPDIIIEPVDWRYMMYGDFGEDWIHPPKERIADHEPEGVVILEGPSFGSGSITADLTDVTPTLLALHDLPIIEDMDGRILREAIADGVESELSIEYVSRTAFSKSNTDEGISEDDAVKGRLEDLGYL